MATATQIKNFIEQLGALACAESARRIADGKGFVLPSVCIAQSAIETGWGTAGIMTRANAYFGIKAGGSWTGAVYRADTWEVADGSAYNTTANFRAYATLADSVRDYYDLIGNNSRYAGGLSFGENPSAWKTPKACITAIWSGGYATDTLYVEKIMNTITARGLAEWDKKIGDFEALNIPTLTLKKSDFVQGAYVISDGGRAFAIEENEYFITLALDKFIEATTDVIYTINYNHSDIYRVGSVRLAGDVASIDNGYYNSGNTLIITAGEKIGISITHPNLDRIPLADLPEDFEITLKSAALPSTDELNQTALAFFVKVE